MPRRSLADGSRSRVLASTRGRGQAVAGSRRSSPLRTGRRSSRADVVRIAVHVKTGAEALSAHLNGQLVRVADRLGLEKDRLVGQHRRAGDRQAAGSAAPIEGVQAAWHVSDGLPDRRRSAPPVRTRLDDPGVEHAKLLDPWIEPDLRRRRRTGDLDSRRPRALGAVLARVRPRLARSRGLESRLQR